MIFLPSALRLLLTHKLAADNKQELSTYYLVKDPRAKTQNYIISVLIAIFAPGHTHFGVKGYYWNKDIAIQPCHSTQIRLSTERKKGSLGVVL